MKLYNLRGHENIRISKPIKDKESDKYHIFLIDQESTKRIYFGSKNLDPYINKKIEDVDRIMKRIQLEHNTNYKNPYKAAFYTYNLLFGDKNELEENFKQIIV